MIMIIDPTTGESLIVRDGMIAVLVDERGDVDDDSKVDAVGALEVGMGL